MLLRDLSAIKISTNLLLILLFFKGIGLDKKINEIGRTDVIEMTEHKMHIDEFHTSNVHVTLIDEFHTSNFHVTLMSKH